MAADASRLQPGQEAMNGMALPPAPNGLGSPSSAPNNSTSPLTPGAAARAFADINSPKVMTKSGSRWDAKGNGAPEPQEEEQRIQRSSSGFAVNTSSNGAGDDETSWRKPDDSQQGRGSSPGTPSVTLRSVTAGTGVSTRNLVLVPSPDDESGAGRAEAVVTAESMGPEDDFYRGGETEGGPAAGGGAGAGVGSGAGDADAADGAGGKGRGSSRNVGLATASRGSNRAVGSSSVTPGPVGAGGAGGAAGAGDGIHRPTAVPGVPGGAQGAAGGPPRPGGPPPEDGGVPSALASLLHQTDRSGNQQKAVPHPSSSHQAGAQHAGQQYPTAPGYASQGTQQIQAQPAAPAKARSSWFSALCCFSAAAVQTDVPSMPQSGGRPQVMAGGIGGSGTASASSTSPAAASHRSAPALGSPVSGAGGGASSSSPSSGGDTRPGRTGSTSSESKPPSSPANATGGRARKTSQQGAASGVTTRSSNASAAAGAAGVSGAGSSAGGAPPSTPAGPRAPGVGGAASPGGGGAGQEDSKSAIQRMGSRRMIADPPSPNAPMTPSVMLSPTSLTARSSREEKEAYARQRTPAWGSKHPTVIHAHYETQRMMSPGGGRLVFGGRGGAGSGMYNRGGRGGGSMSGSTSPYSVQGMSPVQAMEKEVEAIYTPSKSRRVQYGPPPGHDEPAPCPHPKGRINNVRRGNSSTGDGPLLAPLMDIDAGKHCLVLDLDETLVHSSFKYVPNADYVLPVELDGTTHYVYVCKRPGCEEFLTAVGERYEVVLFTASLAKYADPLLDLLDPGNVIRARLFREACVFHEGSYVKDMSLLGRSPASTIIVDNSPASYLFQPENALPCDSFIDDMSDTELYSLADFLIRIAGVADVRQALQQWTSGAWAGGHDLPYVYPTLQDETERAALLSPLRQPSMDGAGAGAGAGAEGGHDDRDDGDAVATPGRTPSGGKSHASVLGSPTSERSGGSRRSSAADRDRDQGSSGQRKASAEGGKASR